jgi:hypothetical protein
MMNRQRPALESAEERSSPAGEPVADALDRLLDPLENLRRETFRSEPLDGAQTNTGVEIERLRASVPQRPRRSAVLRARLRHSNHTPWPEVRLAVRLGGVVTVATVIGWVIAHMS